MFSRNEPLKYQYVILGLIRHDTKNNQKYVFILNQAKITNKIDQLYTSWARHIGQYVAYAESFCCNQMRELLKYYNTIISAQKS